MSVVATLLSSQELVGVWSLVPQRSTIRFENSTAWGVLKVRGGFTDFSGGGEIKDAQTVSGRVDIKAESVDTGFRMRDADLRLPGFFDVENYPEITVVVTGGEPGAGETVRLNAELTVKGITGPLPLTVNVATLSDGPDGTVRLTTETTVTRKQFAVEGNFFGMVGPKTKLKASLVFQHATAG